MLARNPDPKSGQVPEDGLVHVSDEEPGIRRKRAGKGFSYIGPDGKRIGDAATLDRIRRLAVPPAYTDVWISPRADGHIQATGRDQRGRKQYRYHPDWVEARGSNKYAGLADFAAALPALRQQVEHDLRKRGTPREKVIASIVWLLDNTMIRVGNDAYARDNKSFGLTTLKRRHVEIDGSTLRFSFRGKSGKEWKVRLVDRRMARIIKTVHDLPGQELFQYLDEDGQRRPVRSQDVNAYIRATSGGAFSSKHFRTWGGTIAAATFFSAETLPDSERQAARTTNEVIDRVAQLLGNTRAVCRACYIHPAIIDAWKDGSLAKGLEAARRAVRKPKPGLDMTEAIVARWLADQIEGK